MIIIMIGKMFLKDYEFIFASFLLLVFVFVLIYL